MAAERDRVVAPAGTKRRPPAAGKGRRKGSRNKMPSEVREMILGALRAAGGQQYLLERALDPRTAAAFLILLGKVLPLTVRAPGHGPNSSPVVVQFVRTIVDTAGVKADAT